MEIKCIVETTKDGKFFYRREGINLSEIVKCFNPRKKSFVEIEVFSDILGQVILGFGGALTESSGYVLSKVSTEKRNEVLNAYFGEDGLGYTFARTHLNSCDFSLESWSCLSNPPISLKNGGLEGFSMEYPRRFQIPLLKEAFRIHASPINLVLSPWSPPAWMKDNNNMKNGGKLKKEFYLIWAQYITRYIQELEKENIPVWGVTIQNEPEAVQRWESCLWSATEEAEFAVHYLHPALQEAGLDNVKILIWDHNRDRIWERAQESFSYPRAMDVIDGVAYHWYSGDQYEQVFRVAKNYPDKLLIFTEGCVEGGSHLGAWYCGERYAHNIINDLNSGCQAWIDWNIVLDSEGGPNHADNYCSAPILINVETNELYYQSSFYYIGHFSRFLKPGARLVTSKVKGDWFPPSVDGHLNNLVEACAVKNPDKTFVLVVMNRSEALFSYNLSFDGKFLSQITLSPRSIQTLIIND